MPKKKSKKGKPLVNEELEGFDININEFGEIESSYDLEKINKFLDDNVEDKKLVEKKMKEIKKELKEKKSGSGKSEKEKKNKKKK